MLCVVLVLCSVVCHSLHDMSEDGLLPGRGANECLPDPQWDGPHQEWGIACSWEAYTEMCYLRLRVAVSTSVCSGVPLPSIVVVRSGSCPDLLVEQFVFSLSCVVGNYSQVLWGGSWLV